MRALQRGFSLVEMMVAVALMGILMAIAIPYFQDFLVNSRVRAAAENLVADMMRAKAEAASRNVVVELVQTVASPEDVATADPDTAAEGWMVRPADRSEYVAGLKLAEDGQSRVVLGSNSGVVPFTPLGGTNLSILATPVTVARFNLSYPLHGSCVHEGAGGKVRCLQVAVTATGRVKLCDPKTTAENANDPRSCPP